MKWLLILTLLIVGCKESDMAKTADEYQLELVSTNVPLLTPELNALYILNRDGDLLHVGGSVYYISGYKIPTNDEFSITYRCEDNPMVIYPNAIEIFKWSGDISEKGYYYCETETTITTEEVTFTLNASGSTSEYNRYDLSIEKSVYTKSTQSTSTQTSVAEYNIYPTFLDATLSGELSYFLYNGMIYRKLSEASFPVLEYTGTTNPLRPFDGMSTNRAVSTSPMNYNAISPSSAFNSFTLAGVTATQLDYTVKDSLGEVVKTGTEMIDCRMDGEGLLPQGDVTILIDVGQVVDANGTIEISLTNDLGDVYLGSFTANMMIDEGKTSLEIEGGYVNYNSLNPDEWGNIKLSGKPIVRQHSLTLYIPYGDEYDMSNRRYKHYQNRIITLDVTDSVDSSSNLKLKTLVMRGIVGNIRRKTLVENETMGEHFEVSMSFLEVV